MSDSASRGSERKPFAESPLQLYDLWLDAFSRGDAEALAELFEEDSVLLEPPGERFVHGRHAIARAAANHGRFAQVTIHRVDVIEKGDLAILYAKRTNRMAPIGKEPFEVSGTTTDVVRRQADGRWLFVIDNPLGTDVTAPTGTGTDDS